MHRLRWIVTVGAAVCLLVVGLLCGGCSQKQPPEASPTLNPAGAKVGEGMGEKAAGSGKSKKSLEVGDNLPSMAHVHAAKGGERFKRPMGWICTCEFGAPQTILMVGPLDDPELLAVARKADKLAAKAGEDQCLAVVVLPGPKDDERLAAARKWQEENGLDHTLVTVAHGKQDWKWLGAPEKLTILVANEANMIEFKQVGYNDSNKDNLGPVLAGKRQKTKGSGN